MQPFSSARHIGLPTRQIAPNTAVKGSAVSVFGKLTPNQRTGTGKSIAGLLLGACAMLNAPGAGAVSASYSVELIFKEPAYSGFQDTFFKGTFDYDTVTKSVTNLTGTLSEAMTYKNLQDNTTQNKLNLTFNPEPSTVDANGGITAHSFLLNTSNIFSDGAYDTSASTKPAGLANAYATIYLSPELLNGAIGQSKSLASTYFSHLYYGDCQPGGMMGPTCMTGWGVAGAWGSASGSMGGYPTSETIIKLAESTPTATPSPTPTPLVTPTPTPISTPTPPPSGPMPVSLKTLSVPEVPGLLTGNSPIVVDKPAAIALGKALFWDTNVGSDGMACASCHFHAGADGRVKNQLANGGLSQAAAARKFDAAVDGGNLAPNRSLKPGDFPLHQLQNPLDDRSPVSYDTDNVVGSSGSFGGEFKNSASSADSCIRSVDSDYHIGNFGTRRVTQRNAPSVINAVFNHRGFWDGRANNVFNGSNPWGDRDPAAGVWIKQADGSIVQTPLHLANSALASVAVASALSTSEMSCNHRSFKDIGRKLLNRKPLQTQKVQLTDSVLGNLSASKPSSLKPGLKTSYKKLVQQAFNPDYWSYAKSLKLVKNDGKTASYSQMEANFALFFGVAIQLYESTLISDESRFDTNNLNAAELRGLDQFRINQCNLCHIGPNFTAASVSANAVLNRSQPGVFGDSEQRISTTTNVVDRIPVARSGKPVLTFYDTGFASTGVTDESVDLGVGANDLFGNPLSFSKQYLRHLAGQADQVLDKDDVSKVRACDFQEEFAVNVMPTSFVDSKFTAADQIQPQPVGQGVENCFLDPASHALLPTTEAALAELNNPETQKMLAEVNASFKIPSLRNIELTGPYMHNGGMATLEQVLEFYARGGNFSAAAKQITRIHTLTELQLSAQNRQDLLAFLKSLTDDRVRFEKAPFDHPEIKIPHGHVGDSLSVTVGNPIGKKILAKDEYLTIPAVGANGTTSPLKPFEQRLSP